MTHVASHEEERMAPAGESSEQTAVGDDGSSSCSATRRASPAGQSTRETTDKAERLNRLAKLILGSSSVSSNGGSVNDRLAQPLAETSLSCSTTATGSTVKLPRSIAAKGLVSPTGAADSASAVALLPATATVEHDTEKVSRKSEALACIPTIAVELDCGSSENASIGTVVDAEAVKETRDALRSELQPDRLELSASRESLASVDCSAELSASLDESLLRLDRYGTLSPAGRLQPAEPPCRAATVSDQSHLCETRLSSMASPRDLNDGISPEYKAPSDSAPRSRTEDQHSVSLGSYVMSGSCRDRGSITSTLSHSDETTELDDPPAAVEDDTSSAAARIDVQLVRIDLHLHALDEQGQRIAKEMRLSGEDDGNRINMLLETVNRKNLLLRHESDLVCLSKQCELEAKQRQIENRLQVIAEKSDAAKTAEENELQATLIKEKLAVVEQRHRLVLSIEEERIRQLEEDAGLLALLATEPADEQPVAARSGSRHTETAFKKVKDRIKSTLPARGKQKKKHDI